MDLRFFQGEDITVYRKTFTGQYDDDTSEPLYTVEEIAYKGMLYFRKSDGTRTPYEVGYDTELTVIFPYGTEIDNTDIFNIRGTLWETDGIVMPLTNQPQYDRFMKPPTVITMKQHKGNVNG